MIKTNNDRLLVEETLFSTANGYIGIRANFEEGYPNGYDSIRGTYLNGFYDDVSISYGESAVGFPKSAQKLVNLVDAQGIRFNIDGDQFSVFVGELLAMDRGLDIHSGFSYRTVDWISPKGHHLKLGFKRMASFECLETAVISVTIDSVNYAGTIEVISSLEGEVSNFSDDDDPRVAAGHSNLLNVTGVDILNTAASIEVTTKTSGHRCIATVGHSHKMHYIKAGNRIEAIANIEVTPDEKLRFVKYIVYTDSIRHTSPSEQGLSLLDQVIAKGCDSLFEEQKAYLDHFWRFASIGIKGDVKVEEAVNYSIYQLLSSAGRKAFSQISAKGLSGEGYEGHYFWDTEIYLIPMFTLLQPDTAKKLLSYRYDTLDSARARALEMGHDKGAKIPWRTISGTECSAYFPAGSAQYHINADVAYAIVQYYLFTDDVDFIINKGFELLFETARIWIDMGNFDSRNLFCINAVTGPDEYTAIVNNNYYTNAMAKYHLEWTLELLDMIVKTEPGSYEVLRDKLDIHGEEVDLMGQAAKHMCLPYDSGLDISIQDEGFLQKPEWDIKGTPKDKFPLLLNYHPLTIYRHKVLKQADTVLAHFLLDNENERIMKRSYDYYEKLTTHDSSLSPCVHSMMAARTGDVQKAYEYYMDTVRLDLDNLHHNTKDGLHIANAGGVYMGIVYGFGGLRIKRDGIHLRPVKPKAWQEISFTLNYRRKAIRVLLGERIVISTDAQLTLQVYDKTYEVNGSLEVSYNE